MINETVHKALGTNSRNRDAKCSLFKVFHLQFGTIKRRVERLHRIQAKAEDMGDVTMSRDEGEQVIQMDEIANAALGEKWKR